MITIKHRQTGKVMVEGNTYQECFEKLRGEDGVINLKCADLSFADLRNAVLDGANLREADLRGTKLTRADLQGAYLRDADLRNAGLDRADLSRAYLVHSDLQGADLQYTNLSMADLRGTDLRGANLQMTNLSRADLREADLTGANIDYASWPLWCGSLNVKVDENIKAQILYHALSLLTKEERASLNPVELANKFHGIVTYNLPKL
jgi:hypothetical protein